MKLTRLFKACGECEIKGLSIDSRKTREGDMFFALEGVETDGHKYVEAAIEKGAVCVVHSKDLAEYKDGVIYIKVNKPIDELNRVCNIFFGEPSHKMTMFGVTGTNGKSTTSTIIEAIYSLKEPCGYMGTIAIDTGKKIKIPDLTTPDSISVHSNLKEMVDNGMKAAAIEVSSHGLSMGRADSVDFDYAVFTNLTHDHLDYHKTMEAYLEAKEILFKNLKKEGVAAINVDDMASGEILKCCSCKTVTYGVENEADYMAKEIVPLTKGTKFVLCHGGVELEVYTNLCAIHNIYNLLGAIAITHEAGIPLEKIVEKARELPKVPGRLEYIDEGQNFDVIVDYAHTPDGFEKIFTYGRSAMDKEGKLIAVFGAAGKRDKTKRPVLGKLAAKYCDKIVLTEQDVRNESPREIADEIISGMEGKEYSYIESRRLAIETAIRSADRHDLILILGKGDEPYLYGKDGRDPWPGDNNVARDTINQLIYETDGSC